MTKKDFQLIAGVIAGLQFDGPLAQCNTRRYAVAEHFADVLSNTNPLFKRELFIQAATGIVAVTARKAKYEPSPAYGVNADGSRVFGKCDFCGHHGKDCHCDTVVTRKIAQREALARTLASDLAEDR